MSTELNKSIVGRWSKLWMFATVAMLIALVISGPGASLAYAKSNQVPFKASFSGTVAVTGPTSAVLNGSGMASHLGNTAYTGNVSDITPTASGFTDVLVETLTAANGDTITILCNQVAVQESPGVFVGTDEWTVIGGHVQYNLKQLGRPTRRIDGRLVHCHRPWPGTTHGACAFLLHRCSAAGGEMRL